MAMNNRTLRPRVSGFSPKSISNLELWLDADDSSTLTTSASAVSEWRDKSSSARVFSQSTANNRPVLTTNVIGGRSAVRFDGANDVLVSTTNAGSLILPSTMFIVANKPTNTADGGLLTHQKNGEDSYNSDSMYCITTNSNAAGIRVLGGTSTTLFPGVQASTAILGSFIMSLTISTNSGILRNLTAGVSNTDSSVLFSATPSNNGLALGVIATWNGAAITYVHYLTGDIAEVIGYSKALSASEASQVGAYLAKKYGLTLA